MFMAALFTIAKLQKQSKCLSIDEWMKMLYITIYNIYTIEYYSDIKMKPYHLEQHGQIQRVLSEISQTEIKILYDINYMWNLNSKSTKQMKTDSDTKNVRVVARGEGMGVRKQVKEIKRYKPPVISKP